MSKPDSSLSIQRSSAAEYLTFIVASEQSVIQDFRITAQDGKNYNTKHYNLNGIQNSTTLSHHFSDVGKMVELDLVNQCQIDNLKTIQKAIVIEKGRWC